MAQLAQGLRFDLADALARDREAGADLLERVIRALTDAEAQPEHLLLAWRERGEHLARVVVEVARDRRLVRRRRVLVLDEVPEVAVLVLADGCLERDRLACHLEDAPDLLRRELHPRRDLLRGRLAPDLLHQRARDPNELVDGLDHVDGDANRPRLIRDGARDRLPDPPGGVRRELVPPLVLELVDRAHEPDVSLLDEVEELEPAMDVALGDRDDQAEVRLDQLLLGRACAPLGCAHGLDRARERRRRHARPPLELAHLAAHRARLALQNGPFLAPEARGWSAPPAAPRRPPA